MEKERGSILLYTILMLVILSGTALSLARIFLPKLYSITQASNSTIAIYAADAASEVCLYNARKQPGSQEILTMDNGAMYTIASESATEVDITANCKALYKKHFKFRAKASFNGTFRALEISQ